MTSALALSLPSRSLRHRLTSTEPLDVVPKLLALLVIPRDGGWMTGAGVIAAVVIIATPALMRSPVVWLAIGMPRLTIDFVNWHGIDDHEVLISYTCIAFGLALWCPDPARIIRQSLPVLVGLTMAMATLWKLGSGQFLDGDTLRYTLLTDPRFELATSWFGGMDDAAVAANDAALASLRDPAGAETVTLVEPARLTLLALGLTVGAVLLEGWLAIVYLQRRSRAGLRAGLLAIFCLATYVIVPVSRFGLILCTCAYAGSEERNDRGLLLGAVAFCLIWPPIWIALGGTQ